MKDGESTEFILFMLKIIQETLIELLEVQEMTDKITDKNRERMEVIIKYLSQHDYIDNKEVQNLLAVSEATAKRCLNKLVKENILEAVGEYKARKYIKREKD
ncbi:huntington interacting protein HYPE [Fusobacterium necrophorum subsp. funduliforme B35]|uniref:DeoR family transcriptional regulator n=1 Tax=Fusobacterium necrophorum subsp. funduliforme B35 TaxID=1226633 RepID=A0A017H5D6_9FUSO|nr:DeoR family transcriptional regulator [Fusobacterium necrophorum]EYD69546.1 huntington interacting protein HYPE [Fusobacterium necrophorum subsp. funduliforme B35]KID48210.1 DeoR family transcriptional regulator [Fusobacterium necrophorum subsp. funduliforme B35]